MGPREALQDVVLGRAEILELVHQEIVPARGDGVRDVGALEEQRSRHRDEVVEVQHVPAREVGRVVAVQLLVCGREGVLLQPPPAEEREQRSASLQVDVQAAQDDPLILFVRHAEALAQAGGLGVLPEDAEAQRVQRSPRHLFRPIPEGSPEPHGDLLGGFVGERHGADPGRRETEHLDKMADPADQAESLAGARTGHHEHRAERGLDGGALLGEGVEVHHARSTV